MFFLFVRRQVCRNVEGISLLVISCQCCCDGSAAGLSGDVFGSWMDRERFFDRSTPHLCQD